MTIAIVGLGLMGGSLAKAIKACTDHTVFGLDISHSTIDAALREGAVDRAVTPLELRDADIVFVCLNPDRTISFILENLKSFKRGSIISDICGVKTAVTLSVEGPLTDHRIFYVGTHPMAGREFSGFDHSQASLFVDASFIITTTESTSSDAVDTIRELALSIKFGQVIFSTPQEHDRIIAFTSQLAHVVSSAYIKSPTLSCEHGFSAGSFRDLTRVARLNGEMWSSLFLLNRDPLLFEIDTLIHHLEEYRRALLDGDRSLLEKLLHEGCILKEKTLG